MRATPGFRFALTGCSLLCLALSLPVTAHAQAAASGAAAQKGPAADASTQQPDTEQRSGLHLDDIVVTGTSTGQKLLKAPYAISVLSAEQIADRAPTSVSDVLKGTAGLWVESTAGSAGSENIYVRGLPGGGQKFFNLQEDGLPIYETQWETYNNSDIFVRTDLGVQRVEIVRGGTAPIFQNNAPGGVANFITNHGTKELEGTIKLTTGSNSLRRIDGTVSGPVAPNLLMSFSGFYRVDDGQRYPGYSNGDRGGQFKIGATYLLPNGKIWADFKYLNDHGIFYAGLPLTNPVTGESLSRYLDPSNDTLISASMRNVNLRVLTNGGGNKVLARDLKDGIHPDIKVVSGGIDLDLGGGFAFADKARYMWGTNDIDYFLNGQYARGGTSGFSAQAYANSLVSSVAGATSGRYVLAGTSTVVSPNADLVLANNYVSAHTKLTNFMNDARLSKTFETGFGRHELTAGVFYSHFTYSQSRYIGTFLSTIDRNAPVLDVQALDASGNVLGRVTENGFTSYGNGADGSVTGNAVSFYGEDTWHITDKLQIDVGIRHQITHHEGYQGILTTQNLTVPGVIVPIAVRGPTSYVPKSETLRGTAWTLGASYQLADPANLFARYTKSYSMPRLQNIYAGSSFGGAPLTVTKIDQIEGGLKLRWPSLSVSAIGFYSHFDPLQDSSLVQNSAGDLVQQNISASTTSLGAELEAIWSPVRAIDIRGDVTLQKTKVKNVTAPGFNTAGTEGNWIPRIPEIMAYIEPAYNFEFGPVNGRLFVRASHVGKRFQDYNNLSRIPAYETLDAGLNANYGKFSLGVNVINITNSVGLTEGNARASAVGVSTSTGVADATIGRPIYGRAFTVDLAVHW